MITGVLLSGIFILLRVLISPFTLLSDVTADSSIVSAIASAKSVFAIIDPFFPVGTLLTVIGIFLAIETYVFTYKLIMWVIKKIPTIN